MRLIWVLCLGAALLLPAASMAADTLKLAVAVSLTGFGSVAGQPALNGARMAMDEANADGTGQPVAMLPIDDQSTQEGARAAAREAIASGALVVVGPVISVMSIASGPDYADAGLVSIAATAQSDLVTRAATTFRPVFSTGEMGASLAQYLHLVLDGGKARLIFSDDGYGRTFAAGFSKAAAEAGITVTQRSISNAAEGQEAGREAAADPEAPAVVLGMIRNNAFSVLTAFRRGGGRGVVLGATALASDSFAADFAKEPESAVSPGYFTDGMYAAAPAILDSASAETLAFAARYRTRFGEDPGWEAIAGYDSGRLAIAAMRAAVREAPGGDVRQLREAVHRYLLSLDSQAHAVSSLTGPLWFTPQRGRQQVARIGRFHATLFESAPLQLVQASAPTQAEIASGAVLPVGGDLYVKRQRVVYTGVFVNEIPRVDIASASFTADFYVWLRFAQEAGLNAADATDLDFPELVRGNFDARRFSAQGDLDDGTVYRLWRVRGDFKNDFDLHHYPYDRQTLKVRLFNARSASDRIVYVKDRRSMLTQAGAGSTVAPEAFRNLTQWDSLSSEQLRDALVTASALGDPRLVGVERTRELSGYRVEIEIRRKLLATLAKTLLPLFIMTLIMLAALYFPHNLVKEKITVAVTGALSGAVLLSSVNSQLGAVGYTMAVEYVFYVFFGLCLMSILSVLVAERLRVEHRDAAASRTEIVTRALFILTAAAVGAAAALAASRW